MDESNYDEFGNYIGPDVDSDVDSEDNTRRRGVSMLVRILFCTSRTNDFFPAPLCVNPKTLSLSLSRSMESDVATPMTSCSFDRTVCFS
jgi:hypothetical protein